MVKLVVLQISLNILISCLFMSIGYSQHKTDISNIKEARLASNLAIKNHDFEAISSFWHHDITITTGGGTILNGRKAILTVLEKSFKTNANLYYVRKTRRIKINESVGLAWEEGSWKSYGSETVYQGKYAAMWERVGGEWKIKSQLFVSL